MLLHTQPLHRMRIHDGLREPDTRHYDSLTLVMKVFDLIIESMGLDHEVDRAAVLAGLRPVLTSMDEHAGVVSDFHRHEVVIDRLLDDLRNEGERRQPFTLEYFDPSVDPVAARVRVLPFRLLEDRFHPSGGTVLRLSNEAVNLFLGALELDIEDAQAAAEAVVKSQIERGKFSEAARSAQNAFLQSQRFHDKIVHILRDTRRDISLWDWRDSVPRMLAEALVHIESRHAVEQNILTSVAERLSAMPGESDQASALREVQRLVEACRLKHMDLQGELMAARNVFLDEQARQVFVSIQNALLPHLAQEVLEPLLRSTCTQAASILYDAMPCFLGAAAPPLLCLRQLVEWELQPRREIQQGEVPAPALDVVSLTTEAPRFSPEQYAQVESWLARVREPTTLGDLLRAAESALMDAEVQHLLVLCLLQEFAPEQQDELRLVVDCSDSLLRTEHFFGDDLRLIPVQEDAA